MVTILEYILIVYGIYTIIGVTFKPDFYWNGRAFSRMRSAVGDNLARVVYLILALACIGLGALNIIDAIGAAQ